MSRARYENRLQVEGDALSWTVTASIDPETGKKSIFVIGHIYETDDNKVVRDEAGDAIEAIDQAWRWIGDKKNHGGDT